ncbi:MAG: tRNA (adenosine(37)-N6)-threonylcarbamoyltransferase complex ATPase subunit type 1 TsaE [Bacteroidota bacterium]
MTERTTTSPEETIALGKELGSTLLCGDVVAISGTLGTGKTCFVKGVCESLGVQAHVGSPTFTLINEYPGASCTVVHIDLYRLRKGKELQELGLLEYFDEGHICLVEWPEMVLPLLPQDHHTVSIRHGSTSLTRVISIDRGIS